MDDGGDDDGSDGGFCTNQMEASPNGGDTHGSVRLLSNHHCILKMIMGVCGSFSLFGPLWDLVSPVVLEEFIFEAVGSMAFADVSEYLPEPDISCLNGCLLFLEEENGVIGAFGSKRLRLGIKFHIIKWQNNELILYLTSKKSNHKFHQSKINDDDGF
ncbi:hypothetical protein BpHYR1_016538 [Brachionus plicatilis]|uniref:Uncharacterized protein n=1 Tax=Brachionus plicatilis TaxID=10195 RepID=A0A3M7PSE7_BRAPC|nr:hypothetical protein BpHYR1_016538 [Brachionus plicatilis]